MLDWKSIGRAIKYQRKEGIVTTLGILGVGLYLILSLPDIYVSGSRILVERNGLFSSTEPVAGGATQDNISRRLHAITSTVLSTASIQSMLVQTEMISEDAKDDEMELAIEEFRQQAILDLDNVAVVNQYTGKSGMYSQGLIIEFAHPDAETAFDVANTLTNRVLSANKGKGEAEVQFRRSFLTEQYQVALDKLTEANDAVTQFKNENALALPEVQPLRIRRFEEIASQTLRIEENISRLRRDLSDVRGELATTSADALVPGSRRNAYTGRKRTTAATGSRVRACEIALHDEPSCTGATSR